MMTMTATHLLALALSLAGLNLIARSRALLFILNAVAALGFGALLISTL